MAEVHPLLGSSFVGTPLLQSEMALETVLLQTQPSAIATTLEKGWSRTEDDARLAAADLGDAQMAVVAASGSLDIIESWPAARNELAAFSRNGRLIVAEYSGRYIHIDEPRAVIDATLSVLADARATDRPGRVLSHHLIDKSIAKPAPSGRKGPRP